MLSRSQSLRGKDLFQRLFLRGKRIFCGNVGLFSLPTKDGSLKVGVTFKQNAFPKAVTRHRYKRRALAWIRLHLGSLQEGQALVIHFQKPFPPQEERQALPKVLAKLFAVHS